MPRSLTNYSDEDESPEEGYPALPILTRAQRRRFIEKQQRIIRKLVRDFSPDQTVHYTLFDTPRIIHDNTLGDILRVQHIFYEIIYDQRSQNIFVFYSRDLPEATFTRLQGERDNIPEGPPQFDSDGHEILTDEEFSHSDGEENNTYKESESQCPVDPMVAWEMKEGEE
jgi:hypothetical protein